jgi:hypothetical protein
VDDLFAKLLGGLYSALLWLASVACDALARKLLKLDSAGKTYSGVALESFWNCLARRSSLRDGAQATTMAYGTYLGLATPMAERKWWLSYGYCVLLLLGRCFLVVAVAFAVGTLGNRDWDRQFEEFLVEASGDGERVWQTRFQVVWALFWYLGASGAIACGGMILKKRAYAAFDELDRVNVAKFLGVVVTVGLVQWGLGVGVALSAYQPVRIVSLDLGICGGRPWILQAPILLAGCGAAVSSIGYCLWIALITLTRLVPAWLGIAIEKKASSFAVIKGLIKALFGRHPG